LDFVSATAIVFAASANYFTYGKNQIEGVHTRGKTINLLGGAL
jgi:hypothetical protein